MRAHKMQVMIPEDHRVVVDVPASIRSGPAELIVLVPGADDDVSEERRPEPRERGRMAALAAELTRDGRSFDELSSEERAVRLERVMGVGRGLLSTSEEFARRKAEEAELEERKLAR